MGKIRTTFIFLLLITGTLSALAFDPAQSPYLKNVQRNSSEIYLPMLPQKQIGPTCVATSFSMIAKYYGRSISPEELLQWVSWENRGAVGPIFDNKGFVRKNISRDYDYFMGCVKRALDSGIPVLWAVFNTDLSDSRYFSKAQKKWKRLSKETVNTGHSRIICGYKGKQLIFADSWGQGHTKKYMDAWTAWGLTNFACIVFPADAPQEMIDYILGERRQVIATADQKAAGESETYPYRLDLNASHGELRRQHAEILKLWEAADGRVKLLDGVKPEYRQMNAAERGKLTEQIGQYEEMIRQLDAKIAEVAPKLNLSERNTSALEKMLEDEMARHSVLSRQSATLQGQACSNFIKYEVNPCAQRCWDIRDELKKRNDTSGALEQSIAVSASDKKDEDPQPGLKRVTRMKRSKD